jgi:hypothetical protein
MGKSETNSEKIINIACDATKISCAISRYLKYCYDFKKVVINPLSNPFRFQEALKMSEECDVLIIDAFIAGKPKGFQFARRLKKKTLIFFYSGEIDIENEGSFWLVLPEKLSALGRKVVSILNGSPLKNFDFAELEKKYPALKEYKNHH